MSWEQGDLPVQAGTGQPRVCGCFHLRGAEVSMRTSPPLTEERTGPLFEGSHGDAPAPGPYGQTGAQK